MKFYILMLYEEENDKIKKRGENICVLWVVVTIVNLIYLFYDRIGNEGRLPLFYGF